MGYCSRHRSCSFVCYYSFICHLSCIEKISKKALDFALDLPASFKPDKGYEYSRTQNPTRHSLEKNLAAIENANYGMCFGSGMAAVSTTLLAFLKKGDHVIVQKTIYGGAYNFIVEEFPKYGIEFSFTKGFSPAAFEAEIRPNTKVIYIETPSNPLLTITDLDAIAKIAKMNGFTEEETIALRTNSIEDTKLNALVTLASAFVNTQGHPSESIIKNFFDAGYNKAAFAELIAIVSLTTITNTVFHNGGFNIDFPLATTLEINQTKNSPKINFNPISGEFNIIGKSIPNDPDDFFEPIMNWLQLYQQNPAENTNLNIYLDYFNTSTHKYLLDILTLVINLNACKKIIWTYDEEDEDLLHIGEKLEAIYPVNFKFNPVK